MHRLLLIALAVACANAKAAEVNQIQVHGQTVRVGQSADAFFSIVKPADITNQTVGSDPAVRGSLRVSKNVEVEGRQFTVVLVRRSYSGAYEIESIDVLSPGRDVPVKAKPVKKAAKPAALAHEARTAAGARLGSASMPAVSASPASTGTVPPSVPTFR